MSEAPDVNDILGGGGGKAAVFDTPGRTIGGIIKAVKAREEREYDRNNPGQGPIKTFPSGDVIWGIVATVQTTERDPAIEDDDGVRRIFIEGKRMKDALREALNGNKVTVGGELHFTFTGLGTPPSAGANAPKLWTATYRPASEAAVDQALQQGAAQQAPAATYDVVAASQGQQPWGTQAVPGNVQAPALDAPPGIDPALWATLTPEQKAALAPQPAAPVDAPPPGIDPALWATLNDVQKAAMRNVAVTQAG